MLCSYKYCGLSNKAQSDGVIACPLCYQTRYCSSRCKDLDWTIAHKLNCKGKQQGRQTDVNDTQSTLKSIGKNIDDFEFIVKDGKSELGKGSYGQVKLVKDRQNGQLYAMKILNKKRIFEYWSTENLKREIKIQRRLSHPHIVKLYHYFEDKENVYLILELAENGSLFVYIRRRKRLPEKEAFVYFFQTCLGIEYLHKKNVLHRDLKPENLLLDKQGNIKVCDFGWSAEANQQSKRTTFCGTLDYMAPEMLLNKPYDFKLDIWCLGILLYELIHGYAPFKGKTNQEKGQNIINLQTIEFNETCSFEVKDLISNILKTNPEDRLSLLQIFEHPFMKRNYASYGIDLNQYLNKEEKIENRSLSPQQEQLKARNFTLPQHNSSHELNHPQFQHTFSIQSKASVVPNYKSVNQPTTGTNTSISTYSQDDDLKARVSRVSQRQQMAQQQREIGSLRQTNSDLGFMDRVFQALGCLNRDKQQQNQQF
ncbi:unnamed protein product (macronuclear) [Paramecium tetraurelia]|uniref:Aurora kinase n=1 Tax=Paramecium tetraurelia TaxID=5888 RepID=A0CLD6_PARTE|nr:uncharacterized protein GSPATT00008151001 [Paramecium tetraurelia]CAK71603.1 unnamed protein product [Paramecium tetraurelia]|eukprot:XP_001439000.1 hypothetical protein (macronuclear) [Paramecium tetraurelia strain d4-2]